MNVQIIQKIAQATESEVWFTNEPNGVTTYHLRKDVNGKVATATVSVTDEFDAAISWEVVADFIVKDAAKKFGAIRKGDEVATSKATPQDEGIAVNNSRVDASETGHKEKVKVVKTINEVRVSNRLEPIQAELVKEI